MKIISFKIIFIEANNFFLSSFKREKFAEVLRALMHAKLKIVTVENKRETGRNASDVGSLLFTTEQWGIVQNWSKFYANEKERQQEEFRTEIYERHLSQDCMHVVTASDQNRISCKNANCTRGDNGEI